MNRRAAAAAAVLGLVALTACGVRKSDVVEAGGAATVAVAPVPGLGRVVLYFLGPDGRVLPSVRDFSSPFSPGWSAPDRSGSGEVVHTGPDMPIATDKVLAMLLNGPSGVETAAGLTTGLPRFGAGLHTEVDKAAGIADGRRLLRLTSPFPVGGLSDEAVQQLVCTSAFAEDPAGLLEVAVTGPDGTLPALRCEV
ncbi:hypothetical protein ACGFYZ_02835 [Streptomyces sp. NPDC048330]|uniref:hypothetical protein n=1 Tax=Streptomyces sp. NPDC048330 TaxID=3365533 RepID=UPI003712726E